MTNILYKTAKTKTHTGDVLIMQREHYNLARRTSNGRLLSFRQLGQALRAERVTARQQQW